MKIERYRLDRWYLLPTLALYQDTEWYKGYLSLDLCFLKWGVSLIIREDKWD